MTVDEGPRPGQIIVLLLIWTGATILGIERLDTQPERGTEVKEVNVNININVNKENRYIFFIIIYTKELFLKGF